MLKTLNKVGNSYAMILDKPLLAILQIEPDIQFLITTDGDSIILTPQRMLKRVKLRKERQTLAKIKKDAQSPKK